MVLVHLLIHLFNYSTMRCFNELFFVRVASFCEWVVMCLFGAMRLCLRRWKYSIVYIVDYMPRIFKLNSTHVCGVNKLTWHLGRVNLRLFGEMRWRFWIAWLSIITLKFVVWFLLYKYRLENIVCLIKSIQLDEQD